MSTSHVEPDYVHFRDNHKLDHIPGDYGPLLIGHTFRFLSTPYSVLDEIHKKFGPVSKVSLTFQKMVLALGPDFIKQLTLDKDQVFSARMGYDGPIGDFFAGGLLMRDFNEHKFHRRIMQTAFKTASMRTYVDRMHPIIDTSLARWETLPEFLFYPNIKTLLLDLGTKVFLGLDLEGEQTRKLNEAFLDMMSGSLAVIRKDWPGLRYRKGMNGRRWLERYFTNLVPSKRTDNGTDMASYLSKERSEEGTLYSDKVVAEHLIFLLLAAHDTTTSALTMASYYLAHDQQWQDRLRNEAFALDKEQIEYGDLGGAVPATEWAFKETLRLHPPVPQMMRRTVRETELGGYTIPPHTLVQISPLHTHRMTEWWNDPHRFDPGRFSPEREEFKRHPFQWAPFGGGAHKCIGMHFADMLFKCVMTSMLRRYRLGLPPGYPFPTAIQYFPFAKTRDNLPLILERL